jgi:H+/Cl- antiporter ClcA
MPGANADWLDILLFAGLAILLGGFGFLSAVEGWRRWSDNRRIRNHLRN